jgi:hypothetical protein
MWVISIAALLGSCGQPPAALVKQAEATPAPTQQQDFSNVQTDTEIAIVPAPSPDPRPSGLPTPQFKSPLAQAAFETYLETYRQLIMPPPMPATQVIDASQIQTSLEAIGHAVLSVRQAEQNLKGILSPNELRAFKAYQNQLNSPPTD